MIHNELENSRNQLIEIEKKLKKEINKNQFLKTQNTSLQMKIKGFERKEVKKIQLKEPQQFSQQQQQQHNTSFNVFNNYSVILEKSKQNVKPQFEDNHSDSESHRYEKNDISALNKTADEIGVSHFKYKAKIPKLDLNRIPKRKIVNSKVALQENKIKNNQY